MVRVAATDENTHDIQLLKDEQGGLMMESGITTLTFFRGDSKPAAKALRAQLALVVESNPWLAGRLVKGSGGICLRHPVSPSSNDVDALFTATSASDPAFKLAPKMQYTKMCTEMFKSKKVIVGTGSAILNKDFRVAILTLCESVPGEFALIFSLSHAVGDGRTYYEIFQMLQPGAAVRVLSTTRVMSFSEAMRNMCGRKELQWADSTSATCLYTLSMMFNKQAKCFAFHVDSDRLAAAKSAATQEGHAPYVTTNDILTSAFFNKCRARVGMMGMDCRERVEGVGKELAGNYVTALTLDDDTFATPASIQKMLSSTPYETTVKPLPSCCGWFWGRDSGKFAMVTNWSSFAGGLIQLEGCDLHVHLPVQNPDHCVYDLMIPFASGVGKVGVICWTVSTDEAGLRQALPVGDTVSPELFP